MNQLVLRALALLASAVIAFAAGWSVNGWRLHSEIADITAKRSDEISQQSQAALTELNTAAKKVNESATSANVQVASLDKKLDAIHKEFKNAKPPQLPAGCIIDPIRMHKLTDSAAAVNQAAAGLKLSSTLQAAESP